MATTEAYRNDDTGLTGLFNSMMGFTYQSTLYTMRLMVTNPLELADRVRVSLDNMSDALKRSMDANVGEPDRPRSGDREHSRSRSGDHESRRSSSTGQDIRDDVNSTYNSARRATDEVARDASNFAEDAADILSGRKR